MLQPRECYGSTEAYSADIYGCWHVLGATPSKGVVLGATPSKGAVLGATPSKGVVLGATPSKGVV